MSNAKSLVGTLLTPSPAKLTLLLAATALTALLFLLRGQPALALDTDSEISLTSGHGEPRGIWGNATTIWVTANAGDKIYAYNRANGSLNSSQDFDTLDAAANEGPTGIWSDDTTMYVVDYDDTKVYAYVLSTKSRDSGKDFNLHGGHGAPRAAWSDGETFWVVEDDDREIWAYKVNPGQSDHRDLVMIKDFDTHHAAGNQQIEGIWSDGKTMWVAERNAQNVDGYGVHAYTLTPGDDFGERDPDKDIDL